MPELYNLNNSPNNNGQSNDYNNDNPDIEYSYEDIGKNIFNTKLPNDGSLSFYHLGQVHIDYVEMKRESNQISTKGIEAVKDMKELSNAMIELAGLVEYTLSASDSYNSYITEIQESFRYIRNEMYSQINLYVKQTELTASEIEQLNAMVKQVINNPNLTYTDIYGIKQSISYNDALESYKKEALISKYGEVNIDYLLENCKTSNKIVDVYSYIENNLQDEMKAFGVTTGKEYLNLILESAAEDAKTNREKAVRKTLALNKFLGEHGIAAKYKSGAGHNDYSIDDIATGTDCSSYASALAKLGSSNFEAGYTGVLYNSSNTTALDINNILPGDIIVSHGNSAYEHARFVIAIDKENNRIITTECGGYGGSGGLDNYNNINSRTHVDSFDIDTLIKQGYMTNHVDYGDDKYVGTNEVHAI